MELVEVGGHTFAPELLSDGVIIDVGCRGFVFPCYFSETKKDVYCIDPDRKVFNDPSCQNTVSKFSYGKLHNMVLAISDKTGESGYYENGEGTCLQEIDPDQAHPFQPCKTITMDDLYKITGENVDILKLDCEGAEYIILGETFKPIPKQISVEFHYHCVPELHMANFDAILNRLMKDYTVHNMNWEARHGCGFNYWDVLFIRRW